MRTAVRLVELRAIVGVGERLGLVTKEAPKGGWITATASAPTAYAVASATRA
jgi:hypothetical protein